MMSFDKNVVCDGDWEALLRRQTSKVLVASYERLHGLEQILEHALQLSLAQGDAVNNSSHVSAEFLGQMAQTFRAIAATHDVGGSSDIHDRRDLATALGNVQALLSTIAGFLCEVSVPGAPIQPSVGALTARATLCLQAFSRNPLDPRLGATLATVANQLSPINLVGPVHR